MEKDRDAKGGMQLLLLILLDERVERETFIVA
jgi:hypothetical protein